MPRGLEFVAASLEPLLNLVMICAGGCLRQFRRLRRERNSVGIKSGPPDAPSAWSSRMVLYKAPAAFALCIACQTVNGVAGK